MHYHNRKVHEPFTTRSRPQARKHAHTASTVAQHLSDGQELLTGAGTRTRVFIKAIMATRLWSCYSVNAGHQTTVLCVPLYHYRIIYHRKMWIIVWT